MHFHDPLPPPISTISIPLTTAVDRQSLRAALRLVLPETDADEVAARFPEESEVEDLRPLARDVIGRARLARLLARLPWRRSERDRLRLGSGSGVSSEAAVALALGAGLRLDGRELADVLDVRVEQVGEWLAEGRRAFDRAMPEACRRTARLVGRADDRSLDPDERLELITHLQRCGVCADIVERGRVIDAEIADEVAALREAIRHSPAIGGSRGRRVRRGALVAGAVIAAIIVLLAVGSLANGLLQGASEPAPLVAGQPTAPYSGWLILARGNGSVEARNLVSGETRRLFDSDDLDPGTEGE
ncbi:MAG: hypothetical protein ACRD1H_20640, partial [Vicinamibacterales bacterium]